jgi:hypothetical protein
MNFPATFRRSGSWFEPGSIEPNEQIFRNQHSCLMLKLFRRQLQRKKFSLEATKGLFDGSQTLFINANEEKQIIDAVQFAENGIKKWSLWVDMKRTKRRNYCRK